MAEASRFDAYGALLPRRGMPDDPDAVAVEGVTLGIGDEPAAPQSVGVRVRRVLFRENEPIMRPEELVVNGRRGAGRLSSAASRYRSLCWGRRNAVDHPPIGAESLRHEV